MYLKRWVVYWSSDITIAIHYVRIVYVVVLIFSSKFTLYDGFTEQLSFGSFLSV